MSFLYGRFSPSFAQRSGHIFCVGERIYAGRTMSCDEHMNFYTIFQGAQLFQRLRALQRTGLPFYKLEEYIPPKPVDALMAKVVYSGSGVRERDCSTRKIKCAAIRIYHDLDLMRRRCVGGVFERMRGSNNADFAI